MSGEHGAPHGKGQGSSQHQLVMSKYHREVEMESGQQISVCGYVREKSIDHVWKQDIIHVLFI